MIKRFRPFARKRFQCTSDPVTNGEYRFASWLVPKCGVVFDVGARTDDYLVRLNDRAKFHLFEPMSSSFDELCQKTSGNPNVITTNAALGCEVGEFSLYPDTQSIHQRPHSAVAPIRIRVKRLDDYCQQNGVETIDFLKIDVEGHELEVMKGGRRMILEHTSTMQFEYGGTFQEVGIRLADVFAFLGHGWNFYRVQPDGLASIPKYAPSLDNFEYANYVVSRHSLSECLSPRAGWAEQFSWMRKRRAG